jgi:hypothetical protein
VRKRLIELIRHCTICEECHDEDIADHLLANGVIVPPVKLDPSIEVSRIVFKNRIEVVKNVRYEWNEARFCFSADEADRAEAMFKSS